MKIYLHKGIRTEMKNVHNSVLSKECFCNTIEFMKERRDSMTKLDAMFKSEFDDSCFYPYFKYEAHITTLLKEVMDDKFDYIDYFCWELDFGRSWAPGMITEDDVDIKLQTAEDLWEVLQR